MVHGLGDQLPLKCRGAVVPEVGRSPVRGVYNLIEADPQLSESSFQNGIKDHKSLRHLQRPPVTHIPPVPATNGEHNEAPDGSPGAGAICAEEEIRANLAAQGSEPAVLDLRRSAVHGRGAQARHLKCGPTRPSTHGLGPRPRGRRGS